MEKELNSFDRDGYSVVHMNAYTTAAGQPMMIIVARLKESAGTPFSVDSKDIGYDSLSRPLSDPISRARDEVVKKEAL